MRSIAANSISLILFVGGCATAQPPSYDPAFGMLYDARKAHFELAPSSIGGSCESLRGETFWLFAVAKQAETEYFVLSNQKSEVSGAGVVIHRKKCYIASAEWLLGGESPAPRGMDKMLGPTSAVQHLLASDLLRRYARTFGGKKTFLEAVQKGGLAPHELPPALRGEFEEFAKSP